uniref:Caspase recruitment domain-containing protein 19 n=1 Tax=Myotis myotis TaxID=51298 RepID=A0A7J7RCG9_MYOMY|nr:caspase recruitment domain family member 19 [Myotis myotis]
MTEQTYCDRLVQDTPFLLSPGHLSEQQVDRIILQLNRYCPQILSNKDAEKFRNPRASLRVRLCDLLGHLQRSSERDCQEFYRALYIHAQPLHRRLPSRHTGQNSDLECTDLDLGTASHALSDRGPMAFLACLGLAAGLALLVYCCPPGGCHSARPGPEPRTEASPPAPGAQCPPGSAGSPPGSPCLCVPTAVGQWPAEGRGCGAQWWWPQFLHLALSDPSRGQRTRPLWEEGCMKQGSGVRKRCLRGAWGPLQCHGPDGWPEAQG